MKVLATIIFIVMNLTASGLYEIDTKASFIGGAGLTNSPYFNPAVLNESEDVDFSFKTGIELKTNIGSLNLLNDIRNLSNPANTDFQTATTKLDESITAPWKSFDAFTKLNNKNLNFNLADKYIDTIKDAKRIIENANSIMLDVTSGLGINLNVKHYSLAYIQNLSLDVIPQINIDKIDVIKDITILNQKKYIKVNLDTKEMYQTTKSDYENNSLFLGKEELENSLINIKAVSLMELPLMYSHRQNINYKSPLDGHLNLGVSVKYMLLKKETIIINTKDNMKPLNYLKTVLNSKSYSSASLDFGLLYYPKRLSGFKTGIVFKNITSPKFDDKTLEPMIRYGLAFSKYNINTAFDFDITKNKTLSGRDTQMMGGGIGYRVSSLFGASIGAKQDLGNKDLGTIVSTGLDIYGVKLSAQFSNGTFYKFYINI